MTTRCHSTAHDERTRPRFGALLAALAALLLAAPLHATDGGTADPGDGESGDDGGTTTSTMSLSTTSSGSEGVPTYYESVLGQDDIQGLQDLSAPLPSRLYVDPGDARVTYRRVADRPDTWEVRVEDFERRHEQVDAVYDMILVLPLPEGASGGDGFRALGRGVELLEGSPGEAVSLVYGGEKLRLKRNVALEKTLLPLWAASGSLPALEGSGYRYTAWDTIVTRDPQASDTLRGFARLRYTTPEGVAAPDASDPRLAAFWVTWIPSLRSDVEPYAVRMDVAPAMP